MAKFKYLFIPSTQNLVSLPHLLNIIKCNSVCCLTWSMALGLPHPPCQDLQTRLTGHHWPPPGGEWCPVSPWQIQGRSLQRCGGWAPRTKLLATNDQVLCVSVCQSIWIFTSRAGDSFNFKSPANDVWSLKYQSESFHRTTPAVHSWHGAVLSPNNLSQYYVEIVHVELCHCQCNLAKYQYFWKL